MGSEQHAWLSKAHITNIPSLVVLNRWQWRTSTAVVVVVVVVKPGTHHPYIRAVEQCHRPMKIFPVSCAEM